MNQFVGLMFVAELLFVAILCVELSDGMTTTVQIVGFGQRVASTPRWFDVFRQRVVSTA